MKVGTGGEIRDDTLVWPRLLLYQVYYSTEGRQGQSLHRELSWEVKSGEREKREYGPRDQGRTVYGAAYQFCGAVVSGCLLNAGCLWKFLDHTHSSTHTRVMLLIGRSSAVIWCISGGSRMRIKQKCSILKDGHSRCPVSAGSGV